MKASSTHSGGFVLHNFIELVTFAWEAIMDMSGFTAEMSLSSASLHILEISHWADI